MAAEIIDSYAPKAASDDTASSTGGPTNATTEANAEDEEEQKSEEELACYGDDDSYFSYWTFFGGLFMGVAIAAMFQICYAFYMAKRKGSSYSEPFRFDTFVNP